MPSENIELLHRVYAAMNDRDYSRLPELCHPEVELRFSPLFPDQATYRGYAELEGALRATFGEAFDELRFEPDELREVGEGVLASVSVHARGRESGAPTEFRAYHVWTIREGRVLRIEAHLDAEQALESAGLRE